SSNERSRARSKRAPVWDQALADARTEQATDTHSLMRCCVFPQGNARPGSISRRQFLGATAAVAASWPLLRPARVLGANERLNIGVTGVGGRGAGDLAGVASQNIV